MRWYRISAKGKYVRYVHWDGRGLMNNNSLDTSRLTDDEDMELVRLLNYGLQQPMDVPLGAIFAFTEEGERSHRKLIRLLKKASKSGVRKILLDPDLYDVVWQSNDGQVALVPKQNLDDAKELAEVNQIEGS